MNIDGNFGSLQQLELYLDPLTFLLKEFFFFFLKIKASYILKNQ